MVRECVRQFNEGQKNIHDEGGSVCSTICCTKFEPVTCGEPKTSKFYVFLELFN